MLFSIPQRDKIQIGPGAEYLMVKSSLLFYIVCNYLDFHICNVSVFSWNRNRDVNRNLGEGVYILCVWYIVWGV